MLKKPESTGRARTGLEPDLQRTAPVALRRLVQRDALFRSLISAMSDAVVLRYADGSIAVCNSAAERMLGITAEQMNDRIALHPGWVALQEDGSPLSQEDFPSTTALTSGKACRNAIFGLQKADGATTWISITAEPLVQPGETRPYAALCAMTDITERRASAQALAQSERTAHAAADLFSGLLDAATDYAIIATDVQKVVTYFNRGAEHLLGYPAHEVVGRCNVERFHDPDELAKCAAERGVSGGPSVFAASGWGSPQRGAWTFVRNDGHRVPVELTVNEIRDERGTLTGYIGIAQDITQRKRDERALAAHAAEQEALSIVATLVARGGHPREVFEATAEHAARVLNGLSSGVFRVEPNGEARAVGCWSRADMPRLVLGELLDLDAPTATARVLRTGTSESSHYETAHTGLMRGPTLPLKSGVAAPIEVDGRLWGAVGVGWDDASASDPEALTRLARFAGLIGLAVAGSEAREKLSLIASTDHLTGLANQRTFSDRLEDEVSRARRYGRPLSLVLIDLDHFKLVNDTHGHDAGNAALTELAERLTDIRRQGEVLARVGGEEFAWILPETDAEGAASAAERARIAVAATAFPGIGHLTVSAGFCALDDATSARDLFRHADLALYWAKSNGRNMTFRYAAETLSLLPPDEQARQLEDAKTLAAVRALAKAVDAKDCSTARHSERVAETASALARVAGWDAARSSLLHDAALVHDVGKIGISEAILRKPGRLTDAEYEQVKPHAALGAGMVADLLNAEQVSWIRHHHERFDGTGYPDRLAGTDIPEGARILAVADTWDAMTVARPYGVPRTISDALDECHRVAGSQLCPDAVRSLVAHRHAETSAAMPA